MDGAYPRASASVEARDVWRRFGPKVVLEAVSLAVEPGQVHALLGPNAAGKTTLLRILSGVAAPSSGTVRILGVDSTRSVRALRRRVGLIPSGDRTFYLRLSGLENLAFFGRLHGMGRRQAVARARELLEEVGLSDTARLPVGRYSHGMQKRLSVARGLLGRPSVLLVDEATHDLDPEAAANVRGLVSAAARGGAAVVWATQRVDEVAGFAHEVTFLSRGTVRFAGSVSEFLAHALTRRFVVRLRNGRPGEAVRHDFAALAGKAELAPAPADSEEYVLSLADGIVLGDALASLTAAGIEVLACREERSEGEQAFFALAREEHS